MENKKDEIIVDWVNLPTSTKIESLSCSLHDAVLRSVRSNLLERTISLDFENFDIQDYHNLPDLYFIFNFEGATSVRANSYSVWPGNFSIPQNISSVEHDRLWDEYVSKWREESLSWNNFENFVKNKTEAFVILNAEIAFGQNTVALYLDILGDKPYSVFLRADKFSIRQNDGKALTIDQFKKFGEEYWEAYKSRNKKK